MWTLVTHKAPKTWIKKCWLNWTKGTERKKGKAVQFLRLYWQEQADETSETRAVLLKKKRWFRERSCREQTETTQQSFPGSESRWSPPRWTWKGCCLWLLSFVFSFWMRFSIVIPHLCPCFGVQGLMSHPPHLQLIVLLQNGVDRQPNPHLITVIYVWALCLLSWDLGEISDELMPSLSKSLGDCGMTECIYPVGQMSLGARRLTWQAE